MSLDALRRSEDGADRFAQLEDDDDRLNPPEEGRSLLKYASPTYGTLAGPSTPEVIAASSLGRHLGFWSTLNLIVGRILGTAIFATPSAILGSVGSPGASLLLWLGGLIFSFAGQSIYIELACMMPRSGGEKVYLERVYQQPRFLITYIFASHAVLLGFTAAGCIVFAQNFFFTLAISPSTFQARGVAVLVMLTITFVHGFLPRTGVLMMNALAFIKIGILLAVVMSGFLVLLGVTRIQDPYASFREPFKETELSAYYLAMASFKVCNSFVGWSNAGYVMQEVKDPVRTIKKAGPLALAICGFLLAANVAYFAAATPEEIKSAGTTVASLYFYKVFGPHAARVLSAFIAVSAFGNVASVTFSTSRLNQELAKEGILPFSRLAASSWPAGAPLAGLIVHLIPSVLIIVLPPPGSDAYSLILDTEMWPAQVFTFLTALALLYLRLSPSTRHLPRPHRASTPAITFYLIIDSLLLICPWLPPPASHGRGGSDSPGLPYYLAPLLGASVLLSGTIWWSFERRILPKVGKYDLVPIEGKLKDGTEIVEWKKVFHAYTAVPS